MKRPLSNLHLFLSPGWSSEEETSVERGLFGAKQQEPEPKIKLPELQAQSMPRRMADAPVMMKGSFRRTSMPEESYPAEASSAPVTMGKWCIKSK